MECLEFILLYKSISGDVEHYISEASRQQDVLNSLEKELDQIENDISGKDAAVTSLKLSLQKSTDAQVDLIRKYYDDCQPNLCLPKCIPGVVVNACQNKQDLYIMEQQCVLVNEKRGKVQYVQNTAKSSYIELDSETSCFTKCPPLTEFFRNLVGKKRKKRSVAHVIAVATLVKTFQEAGGTEGAIGALVGGVVGGPIGGIVGGVIGSAFASCDKRCIGKLIPKTRFYNVTTIQSQVINYTDQISACENVLKRHEVQGEESSACLEDSTCSDLRQDVNCTTKQNECAEKVSEIKRLHNKTIFDASYLAYQQEVYVLDLLKKRRDILKRSLSSKTSEAEIVNSTLKLANSTLEQSNNKLWEFNKTFETARLLMEHFKEQHDYLTIRNISYSHYSVHGSKYPQRLLLSIASEDKSSRTYTISTMFDLTQHNNSVNDAALESIEELSNRESNDASNQRRRRRRSLPNGATANQLQQKCFQLESSILFLTNFLIALRTKIDTYSAAMDKISASNLMTKHYFANLQNVTTKVSDNLEMELNLLHSDLTSLNSSTPGWHDTLKEFLLSYSMSLSNQIECFSLRDCTYHNLDIIRDLFKYGDASSFIATVQNDITTWTNTFPKLIDNGLSFSEMKTLVTETHSTFIETKAVSWYCGQAPILNGTLSGDSMHLKEGDTLTLTFLVRNEVHDTQFQWMYDRAVLPDQYKGTLKIRSVVKDNSGWYSCKATNTFGTTDCGIRKVIVYSAPTVRIQPRSMNVYEKSPGSEYVYCNSTDADTVTWYHQQFSTSGEFPVTNLPYTGNSLSIHARSQEFQTGHYWCEVSNRMFRVTSEKMVINRLPTEMAVERLGISFQVETNGENALSKRRRRDATLLPAKLSLDEIQHLRTKLAATMNTTAGSIQNLTFSKTSEGVGKVSFVLEGSDFAQDLSQAPTWDAVTLKKLKDRENLLLRAILLYYGVNNTLQFKVNGEDVVAVAGSLTSSSLDPKCRAGLVLNDNGITCGK